VFAYVARAVFIAASVTLSLVGRQALAKDSALLPGGATTLREGHGDWVVSYDIVTQNGADQKVCGLSREQTSAQSRRTHDAQVCRSTMSAVNA
jgi:invasion protein IalB